MGAYEYMDYRPVMFAKPGASGDCSSWSNACELRQALSIASPGVQIWAAAGTYNPLTSNPDPREATFQLKSGVAIYGGFAGTETSLAERDWETNLTILSGDIGTDEVDIDNSYHVVSGSGVDDTAVLDGFTITGGNANGGYPANTGGGMYIVNGSPTLTYVTFSSNFAFFGSGMSSNYSSPTLTNVIFSNNTASSEGGGMSSDYSSPTLTNVTFSDNFAMNGGGMGNYESDPLLTNVTFSTNTAAFYGGGMYNGHSSSPSLINVTFSNNAAGLGNGIYVDRFSSVDIRNSIFWGNGIEIDAQSGGQINYSLIEGGCPTGASCNNIITDDPLLDPLADNGGFTLTHALGEGSPAIDAGDPTNCPATDQRGYTRPIGAGCDIGAYEYGYTLTVLTEGSGSILVDPLKPEYNLNELVMLTATADPEWTFTGWSGDATGSDNPLLVTMSANKTITATFTQNKQALYLPLILR